MEVTLKDYLDRPLESYCSEILSEWRNMNKINVPVKSMLLWQSSSKFPQVSCIGKISR